MPSIPRKKFNIGVTGTREGITADQQAIFDKAIGQYVLDYHGSHSVNFHHGCHIGADMQAAIIVNDYNINIIAHPPIEDDCVGVYQGISSEILEPLPYVERDRKIVDVSDLMFVFPKDFDLDNNSGTVTTYKYALQQNKPYIIIYPDGTITDTSCLWK